MGDTGLELIATSPCPEKDLEHSAKSSAAKCAALCQELDLPSDLATIIGRWHAIRPDIRRMILDLSQPDRLEQDFPMH